MEKKLLALIGAIVTLAALAVSTYFIVSKIIRKKGYCCEEVDFDNYVEYPSDDSESISIEDASTELKDEIEDVIDDVKDAAEDIFDDED